MRPLRLEFQAFGSYPGKEVVDFEALGRRGLFVVTGPTGTGKTTVFDAMVYALYGQMPGGRSSAGEPRSHHADAGVETYVDLIFEAEGKRYQIRRTPAQERAKQRGTGTVLQAADATLVEVVGSGTNPLATRATNCTTKCAELVGLDAKQFQRVVLLPQGKFTDFLIATDEDRENLLRQLFGGEIYEQATKLLKDRMLELGKQVAGVDAQVQHHRVNADAAYAQAHDLWVDTPADPGQVAVLSEAELRDALAALAPARAQHQSALDLLRSLATEAAGRQATAEAQAQLFDDAASAVGHLEQLEAAREAMEALDGAVQRSRRARPVVEATATVERAAAAAAAASDALAAVYEKVAQYFDTLGRPAPHREPAAVATAVAAAKHDIDEQVKVWQGAQAAVVLANQADTALTEAEQAQATLLGELHAAKDEEGRLRDSAQQLEPVAAQVPVLEGARDSAALRVQHRTALDEAVALLRDAEAADQQAKTAYEQLMARFVATQAPRLAKDLRDGEACPVCGSHEHPAPAPMADGDAVDHDEVDAARTAWSAASGKVAGHHATIDGLRNGLGAHADEPTASLADAAAAAELALQAAAAAATQLADVKQQIEALGPRREALEASVTKALADVSTLKGVAGTKRAEADRLAKVVSEAGIEADALEMATYTVGLLADAAAPLASLATAATVAAADHEHAARQLADSLVASGYHSVEEAAAELLDRDEELTSAEQVASWRDDVKETSGRVTAFQSQSVPSERPDPAVAIAAADEARQAANEAAERFTTADNALAAAGAALDQAELVAASSADLRQQALDARTVFMTCNGQAGMGVKLERWVLAGELNRVTHAANDHLARMSGHRYRLLRDTASKGGLTLRVFDAHTGRDRATASLSGGEQFQASLSLALGLADVVSHGGAASGKVFEALFVDEGFGSLDPQALDDAINALAQLHAAGRMVGAITHVEAMKQQLHVGIEVRALADGRGSTLTVNP